MSLSIVIPVYRGASTIGQVVAELSALNPEGGLEIIVMAGCWNPQNTP